MKRLPCENYTCLKLLESVIEESIAKDADIERQIWVKAIFTNILPYFDSYIHGCDDKPMQFALRGIARHMNYLTCYFSTGDLSEDCGYRGGRSKTVSD